MTYRPTENDLLVETLMARVKGLDPDLAGELSDRVHCALCGHRMQGNFNHDAHHYRCKFTSDRAPVPGLDHPKSVYVRESAIVPKLDEWIGGLFDPANLDEAFDALASAGGATDADHARIEAATRKLTDCDERLAKYRKALDAGADPVVVAGWMSEVQGERLGAGREIGLAQPSGKVTKNQVRELVASLGGIVSALVTADPKLKAEVYEEFGISVTYDPTRQKLKLESRPQLAWAGVSVGGGIRINTVGLFDASRAWGSSHVGARIEGNPVREVGTTELWLPAA